MVQILKAIKFPALLLARIHAFQVIDGRKSFSDAAKRLIELGLAPPEKTPEEIAATKRKAQDAKDAIVKMLNRHNVDDDKWIYDGSIDQRNGKEK